MSSTCLHRSNRRWLHLLLLASIATLLPDATARPESAVVSKDHLLTERDRAFELLEFEHELRMTRDGWDYLHEPIQVADGSALPRYELFGRDLAVPTGTFLQLVRNGKRSGRLRSIGLRMLSPRDQGLDIPLMTEMLKTDDRTLRLEVVRTLQTSTLYGADELLRQIASSELNDNRLRAEAILGLASHTGDPLNVALLLRFAQSENRALQREALRSLRGTAADSHEVQSVLLRLSECAHSENAAESVTGPQTELAEQLLLALAGVDEEQIPSHLYTEARGIRPRDLAGWQKELARGGDPASGRRVFFHSKGAQCARCHKHLSRGGTIASDLTGTGRAASREWLIESIIEPSRQIPAPYITWTLVTTSGVQHTGLILDESREQIVLGTAEGKRIGIHKAAIEIRKPQPVSLMPHDLVNQMTVEEFRDLVAFLSQRW